MFKDDLKCEQKWNEFLEYKLNKDFIGKEEKEILEKYIMNKQYLQGILENNKYVFSIPKKHIISKNNSKKRIIYTYNEEEMIILKYVSYLLYDYDFLFSSNLYSFRQETGVKRAIANIKKIKNLPNMYGYKIDIQNYFNSIDVDLLLKNLEKDIEEELFIFIKDILKNDKVLYNENIIEEKKGVMAGLPFAAFLANYYIKEIDEYFLNKNVFYIRYSDDIIMFCNTKEELLKYSNELKEKIKKYNLSINPEKEAFFNPKEEFNFLGFSIKEKTIDVSKNSIQKIKGKIRRSARGIRRWMIKNNATYHIALKAMNRKYNQKFFGKQNNELSWKYWYFPQINTIRGLKEIDNYMQNELRYIVTGKHNKRNYQIVPYEKLKECNYRPLVHEYYKLVFNVENKV